MRTFLLIPAIVCLYFPNFASAQEVGQVHYDKTLRADSCGSGDWDATWIAGDRFHFVPTAHNGPSHDGDFIQYSTDGNDCWDASWKDGQFFHHRVSASGNLGDHSSKFMIFTTPGHDHYMAFREGDGFKFVFLSHGPLPTPDEWSKLANTINDPEIQKALKELMEAGIAIATAG